MVAAIALGGVSLLGSTLSSTAQDAEGSPACAPFAERFDRSPMTENFKAEIKCELDQIDLRIAEAKRQGREADLRTAEAEREIRAANAVTNCVKYLSAGIANGTVAKSEVIRMAGGKVTDENACVIARSFGYGRQSQLGVPKIK